MKKSDIDAAVAECIEKMKASKTPRTVAADFIEALRKRPGWSRPACDAVQWEVAEYLTQERP